MGKTACVGIRIEDQWGCVMSTVRLVYRVRTMDPDRRYIEYRSELTAQDVAELLNSCDADRLPAPRNGYGWWEAEVQED